jgi:predicted oxidoreductase
MVFFKEIMMNTYAINYSVILVGYMQIQANSKTDAIRKIDHLKDEELIEGCDEIIDLDIHGVDKC